MTAMQKFSSAKKMGSVLPLVALGAGAACPAVAAISE